MGLAIPGMLQSRKGTQRVQEGLTTRNAGLANAGWILGIVALVLSALATIFWIVIAIVVATDDEARREFEDELDRQRNSSMSALLVVGPPRGSRPAVRAAAAALAAALALALAGAAVPAQAAKRPTRPVVMVVFDELPLTSLLDGRGRIDRFRYPNFAALAGDSTWYANATTVSDSTKLAIPSILDGRLPKVGRAGHPPRAPAQRVHAPARQRLPAEGAGGGHQPVPLPRLPAPPRRPLLPVAGPAGPVQPLDRRASTARAGRRCTTSTRCSRTCRGCSRPSCAATTARCWGRSRG